MDKYLLEILQDKNTIIIPGLGALTITNKKTGAIKFMPYLTHDDGALSLYISESEGMEENESHAVVKVGSHPTWSYDTVTENTSLFSSEVAKVITVNDLRQNRNNVKAPTPVIITSQKITEVVEQTRQQPSSQQI